MSVSRVLCIALLVISAQIPSTARNKPELAETIDLPVTYDVDFSLASKQRANLKGLRSSASSDESAKVGEEVFQDLVRNQMITTFGLPYHWSFSFINTGVIIAESLPDGEVAAFGGLARLVGTDRGLWAAVLSHEIGHVARRHAVRQVLYHWYLQQQINYYRLRARYGDKSAGWTVVGLQVAGAIAEKKLSRDLEHDADMQGMLLMARAGYHPDYVFAMHHLMRMAVGDQSKFGAFFSTHPRWETRDQRTDRAYTEALLEYNNLWRDPALSPGGPPPVVAFIGKQKSEENKSRQTGSTSTLPEQASVLVVRKHHFLVRRSAP